MKCHVCDQDDRTPTGKCRVCAREIARIKAESAALLPPCSVCGDQDRSPSGGCRPCAAGRKRAQRERETSPEVVERKRVLLDVALAYLARQGQ